MNGTAGVNASRSDGISPSTNSSIAPGTFLYANTTVQPRGCFTLSCKTGQYVVMQVSERAALVSGR